MHGIKGNSNYKSTAASKSDSITIQFGAIKGETEKEYDILLRQLILILLPAETYMP